MLKVYRKNYQKINWKDYIPVVGNQKEWLNQKGYQFHMKLLFY